MVTPSRAQLSRWPLPLPASFIQSSTGPHDAPPPQYPEFVFLGRSNVGKSSFINMLVGHKGLARTSAQPGKTKTLNHYLVNHSWYFTDAPGYGYARSPIHERNRWMLALNQYLASRPNIVSVCLLVDISVPWQKSDLLVMERLSQSPLPWTLIFTKYDKLPKSRNYHIWQQRQQEAGRFAQRLTASFPVSATSGFNRDTILDYFSQMAASYPLRS
ncbi:MAG: ribosome biogenesis GTP-binding protein YihA/YsxC [Flavobacteriales bacterium]|nr:ribosome biogenesis GTP-binding protein YihA/YsxC [Flavobacteriales bacterium]MCX7768369.1 ribosome biogenesis GTP-binding protein YihA/YsxC [Flavobacteriales bacterium]MDW8409071.1 ribosome biogenesis GTP-binding protein YihA/YsxC [Flavobacteriales bacterium]